MSLRAVAASSEPVPRMSAVSLLTRAAAYGVLASQCVLLAPFLLHCLARVPRATPIDYNEGWNAYHTSRLLHGGPLYLPVGGYPVTPVNYPPLSFLVFGAVARWTGHVVLTGRVLSLACLAAVSLLVFGTVTALSASRLAAALSALLWLGLVVRLAPAEVGSYEEQLLGHVFTTAALYLYARWRPALSLRRLWLLALLCVLGLWVKHILVAVPLALALALLRESRKRFLSFAAAGVAISAAFACLTRLLAGPHVLANLLAFDRQMDAAQRVGELKSLFVEHGALALLLPVAMLCAALRRDAAALLAYCVVSLALGAYAVGGVGVDRNAWFDFFIASALSFGTFAGRALAQQAPVPCTLAALALGAGILPVAVRWRSELPEALDYARLEHEERAYLADVRLLRGRPGPALFEEPLLGFDAGKEFLFDPFSGSQMILSGHLRESFLTDRIRGKEFATVALTSRRVERVRRRLRRTGHRPPQGATPRRVGWWTRGAVESVLDAYELYDPGRHRYALFYFPRPP